MKMTSKNPLKNVLTDCKTVAMNYTNCLCNVNTQPCTGNKKMGHEKFPTDLPLTDIIFLLGYTILIQNR